MTVPQSVLFVQIRPGKQLSVNSLTTLLIAYILYNYSVACCTVHVIDYISSFH